MPQRPEMLLSTSTSSLKLYKVTVQSTSHGMLHIDVFCRVLVAVLYTSIWQSCNGSTFCLVRTFKSATTVYSLNVCLSVPAFHLTLACLCFVRRTDHCDVPCSFRGLQSCLLEQQWYSGDLDSWVCFSSSRHRDQVLQKSSIPLPSNGERDRRGAV